MPSGGRSCVRWLSPCIDHLCTCCLVGLPAALTHSQFNIISMPIIESSISQVITCLLSIPFIQQHQSTSNTASEMLSNQFSASFMSYLQYFVSAINSVPMCAK